MLFSLLSVVSICLSSLSIGSFCIYLICMLKKHIIRTRLQQAHFADVEEQFNAQELRNESLSDVEEHFNAQELRNENLL